MKSLEGGNPVGRDVGITSGAGISESYVRDLIKDSLAVFSSTLSSSMVELFVIWRNLFPLRSPVLGRNLVSLFQVLSLTPWSDRSPVMGNWVPPSGGPTQTMDSRGPNQRDGG